MKKSILSESVSINKSLRSNKSMILDMNEIRKSVNQKDNTQLNLW
jgi:hypothetical protein